MSAIAIFDSEGDSKSHSERDSKSRAIEIP